MSKSRKKVNKEKVGPKFKNDKDWVKTFVQLDSEIKKEILTIIPNMTEKTTQSRFINDACRLYLDTLYKKSKHKK